MKVPEKGPKRKLLDVAERLVLEKGFDLVSVRDITGAAKANVAAVHYHFGSREGLLAVVVEHVMEPLIAERKRILDSLGGKAGTEDLVGGYVRSVFLAADSLGMEVKVFMKLVGRAFVSPGSGLNAEVSELSGEVFTQYAEALGRTVPKRRADEVEAAWRFFEMGLAQEMMNVSDGDDPVVLTGYWIDMGTRLVGQAKDGGKVQKVEDQGMLFDF